MEQEGTSSFHYDDSGAVQISVFWPGGGSSCAVPADSPIMLGRGQTCGLRIDHPSVSREHIQVQLRDGAVVVTDLGSANGSRIAGQPLRARESVTLHSGELVEFGGAMLLIRNQQLSNSLQAAKGQKSKSGPMAALQRFLELIAPGNISVMLFGETGVGKEVWARRIHALSPRRSKPWLAINCAAIPEHLMESELFGYEKGAFSGALSSRVGLLESAGAGSILLDEVGELPLRLQAKLLRILETHEVLPLGGNKARAIHARIMSATNQDLELAVSQGTFRRDLFYRLNAAVIRIPPLRDRRDEIEDLAKTFLAESSRSMGRSAPALSAAAIAWLRAQAWPGNIRELKNLIECANLVCTDGILGVEHFQFKADEVSEVAKADSPLWDERDKLEKGRILSALESCQGNQSQASKILGISRRTLINRLDAYGVERPRRKG